MGYSPKQKFKFKVKSDVVEGDIVVSVDSSDEAWKIVKKLGLVVVSMQEYNTVSKPPVFR